MKIKHIIVGAIVSVLAVGSVGAFNVQTASAGQDDFIVPLFSGYVEDTSKASITKHSTAIDMSKYNGAGGIDFDSGKITATSSYTISNAQAGATFCIPYMGTMDELNEVEILVNGQPVQAERLYGEYPFYFAGEDSGYLSVADAIKSVQPTTIKDGTGKVYTFEAIGGEIEFSFQKNAEQTVVHNGASWSSQGVNGYSFKGKNSDMEEYPYQVFVSNGELIDFQANVEYTVSNISYKEYVDYYLNEWIAELGEEYRPYYYSKFNRKLSGGVYDVSDVLYDYSAYTFVLMKVELPIGNSQIVVNSGVYPLVNALYKPYIYTIRAITPYLQATEYSLTIIPSEKLPCLVEQNIGLKDFSYTSNQQIDDGYCIMSADKNPDYALDNNTQQKDGMWILYLGLGVGGAILLGAAIFLIVSWKKSR
ncbi:MAG: hypothetical protein J6A63_09015 [Clostridia bacterium]|nr:hypothetical protein [Clostridia bacterium]